MTKKRGGAPAIATPRKRRLVMGRPIVLLVVVLTLMAMFLYGYFYGGLRARLFCLAPRIQLSPALSLVINLITIIFGIAFFLAPALRDSLRILADKYIRNRRGRAIGVAVLAVCSGLILLNAAIQSLQHLFMPADSGTTIVRYTCSLDLDTGGLSPSDGQEDLFFNVASLAEENLIPANGATMARVPDMPSPTECSKAILSKDEIRLREMPLGSWFCYQTTQRRIGRLYLEGLSSEPHRYLRVQFETW